MKTHMLFAKRAFCWSVLGVSVIMDFTARADWVNVESFFPPGWSENAIDLNPYIQAALDAHDRIVFPGRSDGEEPVLYYTSAGLEVRAHAEVRFEGAHRLVRLPSEGHLIRLDNYARLQGAVIDGNKYAHDPELFPDLGKSRGVGISARNYTEVLDCVVYNNPGHAFSTWGHFNRFLRCRAENVGFIDVRFGTARYSSARDAWSADGFYVRGRGNLVQDCIAYDAVRWGFAAPHSGARRNTIVDCIGGDVHMISYGFIALEEAEGGGRLVRCVGVSRTSRISVQRAPRVEVIDSVASHIRLYGHETDPGFFSTEPIIDGNITHRYGIQAGGYSSRHGEIVPGAYGPVITNNRMYKSEASAPTGAWGTDWSLSVRSKDGLGIVAHNVLFEFDDGVERGPGMHLDNVDGFNNRVLWGVWHLDYPEPVLKYGYVPEGVLP